jgi:hypothetical protein
MKFAPARPFYFAIVLAGTADAASVSGLVRDPSGWDMPRVQLTLALQGGSAAALTAETDNAGRFAFSGLASGGYDLQAQAKGFAPWKMEVRVGEGQEVNLPPIVLQVTGNGCAGEVKTLSRFGAMMRKIKWFFAPPDSSKVILCQ